MPGDQVLQGKGQRSDFRVVPLRHARAVGLGVGAKAHRAAVPGDLAHVGQRALQKAATRSQREHAHAGGDPLLRLAALAHRHEELDGTLGHAVTVGCGHGQKGDDEVQRLVALVGPVLHLLGHSGQRALGAAFDDGAHRVDGIQSRCDSSARIQHRTQNVIGPVGRQPLEPCLPGLLVQTLEVVIGAVRRHIDRLGNGGVHQWLHRLHHGDVVLRCHCQRRHKVLRQLRRVASELVVKPECVVLHGVVGGGTARLALLAAVSK